MIDNMAEPPAPAKRETFEAFFPKLVEEVGDHVKQYNLPDEALDWFKEVCIPGYSRFSFNAHY